MIVLRDAPSRPTRKRTRSPFAFHSPRSLGRVTRSRYMTIEALKKARVGNVTVFREIICITYIPFYLRCRANYNA